MPMRCSVCGKTATELAEEIIRDSAIKPDFISVKVDTELGFIPLCDGCREVLTALVPAILEELGILIYDEEEGYKIAK